MPARAAQAVVEGVLLSRYTYDALRSASKAAPVAELTLVTDDAHVADVQAGAERGRLLAAATMAARDLANTPHNYLERVGPRRPRRGARPERGLTVEVFGKDELVEMGCGGHARRQRRQRRAAAPRQAALHARRRGDGSPHVRRQGDHVRLRRPQPEAGRRGARPDEERHVRRGRRAGGDVRARRGRAAGPPSPATCAAPTTCRRARRWRSATSSRCAAARPSRSSTPTPRAAS